MGEEIEEEERTSILSDSKELKKLAVDYLHPEKPVESSSVNCARNYFDRASASGHADHIHTEGYANNPNFSGDYVQHGYDFHDDYAHHDHHHHHDCDVSHQSQHSPIIKEEDDGKEGNLSRSPSSVMLFDEQAAV